jgi:hypothetical protein
MKLKGKLVCVSLGIVILVMVVTTIAVSIVINRQNSDAAYDRIKNSMNMIRKDLQDEPFLYELSSLRSSRQGVIGRVEQWNNGLWDSGTLGFLKNSF